MALARSRTTLLTFLGLGLLTIGGTQPLLAQQGGAIQVPATAIVRGEDIRLRVDPAVDSQDVTIMQRGDEISITGAAVAANGDEFYPIQLVSTGETGWIRTIFINPLSITPLEGAVPVAPVTELVEEPTLEVVPVPVEEATDRPRRDRDGNNSNNNEEPPPAEEEGQGQRRNRNQDQQTQDEAEAPVEEVTPEPVTETPVADPPAEEPPADDAAPADDAEQPPADSGENGDAVEPAPGTISVSGEGTTTSEPQAFEAQRYRVRALVEASASSSFRVELVGPDDFSEVLVDDTIDQPQTWISRTAVTIETPGEYVVQVSGIEDPWVVEFLPR